MSEPNQIDINSLHHTVLLETENDSLLEIKPNFLLLRSGHPHKKAESP